MWNDPLLDPETLSDFFPILSRYNLTDLERNLDEFGQRTFPDNGHSMRRILSRIQIVREIKKEWRGKKSSSRIFLALFSPACCSIAYCNPCTFPIVSVSFFCLSFPLSVSPFFSLSLPFPSDTSFGCNHDHFAGCEWVWEMDQG